MGSIFNPSTEDICSFKRSKDNNDKWFTGFAENILLVFIHEKSEIKTKIIDNENNFL